jgi:integrase
MSVKLRTKELANGRLSLYLDYFPPIKGPDGKPTRREFLKRYNFKDPKDKREKQINHENMLFADTVRLMCEKQILNEQDGIYDTSHKKVDFIAYFEQLAIQRMGNNSNYSNWYSALKHFKEFSGGKCTMGDINEELCKRFKNYLQNAKQLNSTNPKFLSQNSAVSYFNKFRCAVNEAFEDKLMSHNVLTHVTGIKAEESKREFLTQEELQKLASTETDIGQIRNAALFSALTGLRWSDISQLKWGDMQKTESGYFIHIIQQKTKEVMLHPISDKAYSLLGEKGAQNDLVFKDLVYSDRNNARIREWLLSAGITKKISFHNFRHTYATLLLNKGTDIFTVSKMLGHKNIQTTMIYTKILTETKVNAANVIDIDL